MGGSAFQQETANQRMERERAAYRADQFGAFGKTGASGAGGYRTDDNKSVYDAYANRQDFEKAIGHKLTQSELDSGILAPQFKDTSLRDSQGNLKSQYTFDPTKSEAYNRINTQANSVGPTDLAQAQLNAQKLDESNLQQNTSKQNLTALQQGQAALAQTGGLSSGARERMAVASNRNALQNQQQVGMGGAQARMGILSNDANLKQNLLGQIEGTQLGAQQTNLNALTQDTQAEALWNANQYGQNMGYWGSGKTADAQKAAAANQRGGKK